MTLLCCCELPLKTTNALNHGQGHGWWKTAKERKQQRALVALWFRSVEARPLRGIIPDVVRFARLAWSGGLDSDALPASMKAIRDECAKQLGVDDGPRGPVQWEYQQARSSKAGEFLVRIEFEVNG